MAHPAGPRSEIKNMGRRILVIDDEPELVELVKTWLESKGFEVTAAYNGREGIEKARNRDLSLIILDIRMPGMDGFEVLDRLRKSPDTQGMPVIMLTQKRETKSVLKAMESGTTDYIMKPFSLKELLGLVRRYSWYKG